MSESIKSRKATLKRAAGNIASGMVKGRLLPLTIETRSAIVDESVRIAREIDYAVERINFEPDDEPGKIR